MGLFENMKLKKDGLVKETETTQTSDSNSNSMIPSLVMMNDGVNICATACASCWDTKLPDTYEERAKYIGRRTKTGHTSVIEHSNVVFYLYVPSNRMEDLIEFLDLKNYLHSVVKKSKIHDGFHMLIGGSWRAFSDLYLNCVSIDDNRVLSAITSGVLNYIPSDGMRDIIDAGILKEDDFLNLDTSTISARYALESNHRLDEDINIVNCDDYYQLIADITSVCDEAYLFTCKDLLKFCTVTVEFNNMSRIITQQLTRHRNGITQESQRYVDYSGAKFNSPAKFKPDKYNAKRLYEFKFGGNTYKMNLQNIGDAIAKIYEQLKDKSKYGSEALISEDARGYLPQNVQCGKIYMTFNFYTLIKFLQLREDSHAQVEIRSYATRIGDIFRNDVFTLGDKKEDLYSALIPNIIGMNDEVRKPIFMPIVEQKGTVIQTDKNEVAEPISEDELEKIYENNIKMEDAEENKE